MWWLSAQLQIRRSFSTQIPPGEFGEHKKTGGASGTFVMLEGLTDDSEKVEAGVVSAEQDAQVAHETFTTDSNKTITTMIRSNPTKQSFCTVEL